MASSLPLRHGRRAGPQALSLSPRTLAHLVGAERRRAIEAAGREARAAERAEVDAGIAERVALGEARGEAFDRPEPGRGGVARPSRKLPGVLVLARSGKLSGEPLVAALAYGDAYKAARVEPVLRSCLGDHTPTGQGPTVADLAAAATARLRAGERLAVMRRCLGQSALVHALDRVCGDDMTPREAGGNGAGAAVYTSLVVVGCELMASAAAASKRERV